MEYESQDLPLTVQADLLSLSRSSLYYRPTPPSPEEIAIKQLIDEIYTNHPYFGSRRMAIEVSERYGQPVNRKRIQRYMREMGIAGICPGPNLSKRNLSQQVISPNVPRIHELAGWRDFCLTFMQKS